MDALEHEMCFHECSYQNWKSDLFFQGYLCTLLVTQDYAHASADGINSLCRPPHPPTPCHPWMMNALRKASQPYEHS